jgi:hypothetical protein
MLVAGFIIAMFMSYFFWSLMLYKMRQGSGFWFVLFCGSMFSFMTGLFFLMQIALIVR